MQEEETARARPYGRKVKRNMPQFRGQREGQCGWNEKAKSKTA